MEGPSLYLAEEQLAPFRGKRIVDASGNSKQVDVPAFVGLELRDIFSWGKHLVFQFEDFALRIHFMLYGTFEAKVEGASVTGDYERAKTPRLTFRFENGHIHMFNCSIRRIESSDAHAEYDDSASIMAPEWDAAKADAKLRAAPDEQIADALLDQEIFAGVGNIIKNEILFFAGVPPDATVGSLPAAKRRELVDLARAYSLQFYVWRLTFELKKHYEIYRKSVCTRCGGKVSRGKTGKRARWSFWCPNCQG